MATAKEFIARVAEIEGVAGCLLVREDGYLLGQTIDDPEMYSSLLIISGGYAREIMASGGFSFCRFISFNRQGDHNFHIFPIDGYFLGIVQTPDCPFQNMIDKVSSLVSRVTTGGSGGDRQAVRTGGE